MKKYFFKYLIIINIFFLILNIYFYVVGQKTNLLKVRGIKISSVNQYREKYGDKSPINRFYIEDFLKQNEEYIHGNILELGDAYYTYKFGSNIKSSDILDISSKNRKATIVGDLQNSQTLKKDQFDCFIMTQMLMYPYDTSAVLKNSYNALKKDGVLLITVPGVSFQSNEPDLYEESWHFTEYSLRRKLHEAGFKNIKVIQVGNVLAATAFLQGLGVEDLKDRNLLLANNHSCNFLITAFAQK